jgi:hypothetical protein
MARLSSSMPQEVFHYPASMCGSADFKATLARAMQRTFLKVHVSLCSQPAAERKLRPPLLLSAR